MEIITSANTTTTTNNNTAKSPETETETPTRIQQQPINTNTNTNTKSLSFSNGVLKRHHPTHTHTRQHNATTHSLPHATTNQAVVVTYKECLKNHVASLGGHALDGCGEFMPSPNANENDPSSIKCAACGCHRNFHRREPEEPIAATHVLEYQPHHRHHPPPPPFQNRSPNSASPPPISSYPSAPHMLLALSGGGLSVPPENTAAPTNLSSPVGGTSSRKRFRTKFTQEQKEKMHEFAERVGWKMQKRDDELVMEFCNEVGIDRGVLKVWMHNNKNTFGKRDHVNANGATGGGGAVAVAGGGERNPNDNHNHNNIASQEQDQYENDSRTNVATNGSSSSS